MQFLLNNIYCKRKKRMKEQNVIDIKYTSIDVILCNQIIFENFLKDYKWNDINLKNIENNSLIKKLQSII